VPVHRTTRRHIHEPHELGLRRNAEHHTSGSG
jgi:hypothetical protein